MFVAAQQQTFDEEHFRHVLTPCCLESYSSACSEQAAVDAVKLLTSG
jgi:hypothetical protein